MHKIKKYRGNYKRTAKIVEWTGKQELEASRQVRTIGTNISGYNENKKEGISYIKWVGWL